MFKQKALNILKMERNLGKTVKKKKKNRNKAFWTAKATKLPPSLAGTAPLD